MGSSSWGVRQHISLRGFVNGLKIQEREAFHECLLRLARDPEVDGVVKRPLNGKYQYRDAEFTLPYTWYPVDTDEGGWGYLVKVLGAGRTSDVDADPLILWKWLHLSQHGKIL